MLYLCMCIYICIYIYVCIYIYIYIYLFTYLFMYLLYIYIYVCIYRQTDKLAGGETRDTDDVRESKRKREREREIYIYIYIHIHTYTHVFIYVYIYIYICTHTEFAQARNAATAQLKASGTLNEDPRKHIRPCCWWLRTRRIWAKEGQEQLGARPI